MSDLEVRPVSTEAENQAFLRMPWTVYKDDPYWTAPIWSEHVHFFDPKHNPELAHIDMQKYVAWRGDTPVGTVIAHVNHAYNEFHEEKTGWFGQFELLNDPEAAAAMIKTAEEWVRAKGMIKIMGPATFSTNSEIGLLVKGFEYPPMILTSHAPRYSQGFVEGAGYAKSMDLFCYLVDGNRWGGKKADKIPERLTRVVDKIRERRNFKVRLVNMSDFDNEIDKVKVIYNQAWEKNWGFVPLSDVEINKMATDLKQMIDPNIALFVEVDGEPVAFAVPLPNIYQPLRAAHLKPGEPEILQLLKLVWHWKVRRDLNSVRAWALGILEEYRGSGVDALMYYEMLTRGLPRGYTTIEMSWILENNVMMNRGCQFMGGEVYKIYRVYEKALA